MTKFFPKRIFIAWASFLLAWLALPTEARLPYPLGNVVEGDTTIVAQRDTLIDDMTSTMTDTILSTLTDTIPAAMSGSEEGTKVKRDWNTWRPNPKKAMWLAIVIPGAGQIYNRKYWKLPIVYGGFVGCAYAMRWNNMMYHDYAQAYLDIADDDPETHSYDQFLHLGKTITSSTKPHYEELFKKRKDRYRRWRDLSFFVMCGVYAISIIDAYVDASLSEFDISNDLSMRVTPTIINDQTTRNPWKSSAIGLQCSLNF